MSPEKLAVIEDRLSQTQENHPDAESGVFVGHGGIQGEGPYISIWLTLSQGTVLDVRCRCNGCPSALQVTDRCSLVLRGRSLEAIQRLDRADIELIAGKLPEGKEYYYDLARTAIENLKREEIN
jgi:NifU-like protein involved in Fe-S cluster formation